MSAGPLHPASYGQEAAARADRGSSSAGHFIEASAEPAVARGAAACATAARDADASTPAPALPIAFVVQVVTDLELVAPIAAAVRAGGGAVVAWVRGKALKKTPELRGALDAALPGWRELDDEELPSELAEDGRESRRGAPISAATRPAVLLAPTESNAPAHRFARRLVEQAHRCGVRTATLQHGFDNVGLTWFDGDYPPGTIDFAAQRIFTWGPSERLHPAIDAATRAKCVAIGCSKPARTATPLPSRPAPGAPLIAVFENLHWSRYSQGYRAAFLRDMEAAAAAAPHACFFVRPHPAGKWLTERFEGARPKASNLLLAAPDDARFAAWTTPALLALADGVITTPSTVALDGARAGRPVAVAAYDLALPDYAPLPLLRGVADWTRFTAAVTPAAALQAAASPAASPRALLVAQAAAFVARACLEGDGASRIAAQLLAPPPDWPAPPLAPPAPRSWWRRLFGRR